ncbi:T9SS type A sorting domain-containing protein [Pontibacter sp. Tf4]|uniref:T9SS type A sorting domain-containing protein n=1 Tax=Pontibacter sp. Tf4 TaxID=2761620 RepID=UPI0016252632
MLYQENFSGTGSVAGVYAAPANSWVVDNATPSTVATSSKGNYARTSTTLSGEKNMYLTISTLGYSNATIMWNQFRNPHNNSNSSQFQLTESVELQYSVNGGATRTTFYTSRNNVNSTWNKVNNGTPIALPAAAMGMPDVRIYWRIVYNPQSKGEAYYAIDDVMISAMPETGLSTFDWSTRPLDENPFVVSGLTATAPYTVDGVTMRWSNSLNTGVAYEIAKVDDKNFKAGTKSLTLVQAGATATAGSVVQLDLSQPVEDLTFTIFDVDITAGQFIDKLTVVGYNNGVQVPLVKNKVKTTSYNELSATTANTLNGLISNDNTSAEGDVTITFRSAVTKVVIQYNNALTGTRSNNGRQGISIHNLSWRKEQPIMALPVELLAFKAVNRQSTAALTWATASEKDNDRFEVERSQDGRNFTKIGEVAGSGTTSVKRNYSFTDAKPAVGTNHYRLRQVDFDGTVTYSKTVAVAFAAPAPGEALAKVYPTMATNQVTVAMSRAVASADVVVLDAAGKVVMQFAQVTNAELVVPVQNLKAGMYFVNVTNGITRDTYRFVRQ